MTGGKRHSALGARHSAFAVLFMSLVAGLAQAQGTPAATPSAERRVPSPAISDARTLFRDLVANGQSALVLDASGFVLAGAYTDQEGTDVSEEIGANLSGVSDEADRAVRHLGLGDWSSIVFETDTATVAMTPMPGGGLALVAAEKSTPLGFVRRLLERVGERARGWVEAMP